MQTNFEITNENIRMFRGDTLTFGIKLYKNEQKAPIDSDLTSAYFTVKKDRSLQTNVLQVTLSNGITKQSAGVYNVKVAASLTANVEPGKYYYDLQVGIGTDKYTVMYGVLDLMQDVTTN